MKKVYPAIAVLSFLLTACVGGKQSPAVETYSFTPKVMQPIADTPHNSTVIRMMPATITPEFSNNAFIYRTSEMQYRIDPYREFLAAPNTEITIYLEHLLAPSLNATLVSSDNLTPANFVLQENITELYADYQNKTKPQAVLSIQFILYRCENSVMKQVGTMSLSEKTPIKTNDPASLLEGYQSNLNNITKKLRVFINQKLAE